MIYLEPGKWWLKQEGAGDSRQKPALEDELPGGGGRGGGSKVFVLLPKLTQLFITPHRGLLGCGLRLPDPGLVSPILHPSNHPGLPHPTHSPGGGGGGGSRSAAAGAWQGAATNPPRPPYRAPSKARGGEEAGRRQGRHRYSELSSTPEGLGRVDFGPRYSKNEVSDKSTIWPTSERKTDPEDRQEVTHPRTGPSAPTCSLLFLCPG